MRCFTVIAAMLLASAAAADQLPEPNTPVSFPASEFRKAMMGQEFTARGMIFPADPAQGFAYGYLNAITERETRAGRWCDGHLLPHELMERVFTHIGTLENPDETPADVTVADALAKIQPCSLNEVSK